VSKKKANFIIGLSRNCAEIQRVNHAQQIRLGLQEKYIKFNDSLLISNTFTINQLKERNKLHIEEKTVLANDLSKEKEKGKKKSKKNTKITIIGIIIIAIETAIIVL